MVPFQIISQSMFNPNIYFIQPHIAESPYIQNCFHAPGTVVTIIIAPMKYLLHTIWNFLAQIPRSVKNRLTAHRQQRHPSTEAPSQPVPNNDALPITTFRRKKRKSFRSFLREESRISRNKQKGFARSRLITTKMSHNRHKKMGNFSFSASSIDEHSKDLFTNELQAQCSALFDDNNGLQISAIASIHRQEEETNRLDESDEELIRLLQGTYGNVTPRGLQFKTKRENSRRGKGKAWWENEIDHFRKKLYRNMGPSAGAMDLGDSHLKILTVLDLSQEPPKIFHMPLSLHYS